MWNRKYLFDCLIGFRTFVHHRKFEHVCVCLQTCPFPLESLFFQTKRTPNTDHSHTERLKPKVKLPQKGFPNKEQLPKYKRSERVRRDVNIIKATRKSYRERETEPREERRTGTCRHRNRRKNRGKAKEGEERDARSMKPGAGICFFQRQKQESQKDEGV